MVLSILFMSTLISQTIFANIDSVDIYMSTVKELKYKPDEIQEAFLYCTKEKEASLVLKEDGSPFSIYGTFKLKKDKYESDVKTFETARAEYEDMRTKEWREYKALFEKWEGSLSYKEHFLNHAQNVRETVMIPISGILSFAGMVAGVVLFGDKLDYGCIIPAVILMVPGCLLYKLDTILRSLRTDFPGRTCSSHVEPVKPDFLSSKYWYFSASLYEDLVSNLCRSSEHILKIKNSADKQLYPVKFRARTEHTET